MGGHGLGCLSLIPFAVLRSYAIGDARRACRHASGIPCATKALAPQSMGCQAHKWARL